MDFLQAARKDQGTARQSWFTLAVSLAKYLANRDVAAS
jgi:hypothetical protein